MQALLAAMMNPPLDEDAFNAWYDEEHVPLRLAVPGFLSARRYRATPDPAPTSSRPSAASTSAVGAQASSPTASVPSTSGLSAAPSRSSLSTSAAGALASSDTASPARRYLALYDLASLSVLQSEAYLRLPREPSDRERAMLASIPLTDRRVCELVLDCPEWTRDAPYQLLVCMTPPAEKEDDFVAWYRDEHIPLLLEVPGWRRSRLFRQVEGSGPTFMAVHELESPNVFDHPAHAKAVSTPWRERIRQSVLRRERHLFALWRPMPSVPTPVAASATR